MTAHCDSLFTDDREASNCAAMGKQPVVSVLMLTYNHAAYVAEAIASVLMQKTTFAFELIIGEDASTDATREIVMNCQREAPAIIRVIAHDRNVGMHANHASLINAARGELIAYCEGDDYWIDPLKLQHQVDYLQAHPEAGAVHTDFDHVVLRGGSWRRLPNCQKHRFSGREVPAGNIFTTLLCGNFIQTCTLCVRTCLSRDLLAGGFYKESYPVGDWPMCLYIAAKHEVGYLTKSTATYRKVPGSMMNAGEVVRLNTIMRYVPMIEDFCIHFDVARVNQLKAMSAIYRPMLSTALFAGDQAAFRHSLAWLRQHDPDYANSWRGKLLPWLRVSAVACRILRWIQEARVQRHESQDYQ